MEGLAANRLHTLLEAAVSLSSDREPDLVLDRTVSVARDVMNARWAEGEQQRVADLVELDVADHGRGFNPEEAERLFERYYRSEVGVTDRVKGVGLGPYVSREIVRAHGGEITAHSPGVGEGATFRMWTPGAEAALEG